MSDDNRVYIEIPEGAADLVANILAVAADFAVKTAGDHPLQTQDPTTRRYDWYQRV